MKENIKKVIGISCVIILSLVLCYFSFGFSPIKNTNTSFEKELSVESVSQSHNVKLSTGPVLNAGPVDPKVLKSVGLYATVLPENAPDKRVDWSVSWLKNPFGDTADVNDYITVVSESDGSQTAMLNVYKAFDGAEMLITVTTRVGGFTATSKVIYKGVPTTFNLTKDGVNYNSNDKIQLDVSKISLFDFVLNNSLDKVGAEYGTYEIVSTKGYGKFIARHRYYNRGNITYGDDFIIDCSNKISYFIDFSINDNKLSINPKHTISSYSELQNGNSMQNDSYVYKSLYTAPDSSTPDECYFEVVVKETVSGLMFSLKIDIISTVSGVSIDQSVVEI